MKKWLASLVLAFTFLMPTSIKAEETTSLIPNDPNLIKIDAVINRWVDGDTVDCNVILPFDIVLVNVRVRLLGIDTPELRSKDPNERVRANEAKNFVNNLCPPGTPVILVSWKGPIKDVYGRTLAYIVMTDGNDISTILLSKGLAVVYK